MKKSFEMTQEELDEIKTIAMRPSIPVMKFGDYISGGDRQEDANEVWKKLGNKYGFVWDTAEGNGSDPKKFLATPKPEQNA
jgi:hypothetical protein